MRAQTGPESVRKLIMIFKKTKKILFDVNLFVKCYV